MHLMFGDEADKDAAKDKRFFVYGAIFVPSNSISALHSEVERLRTAAGMSGTDTLKSGTNTKPNGMANDAHKQLKIDVTKAALEKGNVKLCVQVTLHDLARNLSHDDRIFYGANTKQDLLRKMQDLDNRMQTLEAAVKREKSKTAKIATKGATPPQQASQHPRVALLVDLIELQQVRIVSSLSACFVRDVGALHGKDRIVKRTVANIVRLEFLLRLGSRAILRVDGTQVENKGDIHHLLGFDRFAEIVQLVHAELLGFAMLAVEHLLLEFRELHCHRYLPLTDCIFNVAGTDYALRVIVTVAFWPTFGASISTQSPVLISVIGSRSRLSTAGISAARVPLMSISWTFRQMMAAGP